MTTVFMKWLETNPETYDRGIQILTLNRLGTVKQRIASQMVRHGDHVLEIGCGTGTLAVLMARRGAHVTGVDASSAMLAEAQAKVAAAALEEQVNLLHIDASQVQDRFGPERFDVIVATLVFSELTAGERRFLLDASHALLAPGGRLIIADEVVPSDILQRLLYYVIRVPLALLTWLLTRATTRPMRRLPLELATAGFRVESVESYLLGSLELLVAGSAAEVSTRPPRQVPRLQHRVTPGTLLTDLLTLLWRIAPPYPKVQPGLYRVGDPDRASPVLVTGNFDLTVRRLVHAIDGKVNAWILVANSSGINVWCAAGGGFFTAEKIISAINASHLGEAVNHHALILPQLCANGVDGWKIRDETGWGVHWGPVRAEDIPAYLDAKRKKSDAMRQVRFPLKDRLEMGTVTLGFYGLLILVPVWLFWRHLFWPVAASMVGLSYFHTVAHPWLPGRDGLLKSIPLALITLVGLLAYTWLWHPLPGPQLFNWAVALVGLAVFTGAEYQGMSPLLRGEQANWGWEAVIAVVLGLVYWLTPILLGWR